VLVLVSLLLGACSVETSVSGGQPGLRDAATGVDAPVVVDCREPGPDVCDRADNDCDPSTADGEHDPMLNAPCDSDADNDLCLEGTIACVGGALVCDDFSGNTNESCNGVDEDCDGNVDEDPTDGVPGWVDADGDGYGAAGKSTTRVCEPAPAGLADAGGDCDDADPTRSPGATEACDDIDQNCSGLADEGACPCATEVWSGHRYYYCTGPTDWSAARDACRARGSGIELVRIESADENGHVGAAATALVAGAWWNGLHDWSHEGSWLWADDSPQTWPGAWAGGEPNNGGCWLCSENCGEMYGTGGVWNDVDCYEDRPYICEDPTP
jgi:hypothetical protein